MRIGIDLGGTKTEILCLNRDDEEILRERFPSVQENYEKTVTSIRDMVLAVEQKIGQQAHVGIGIPGAISKHTGLVKNANSTWLIGHPFQDDLEKALERDIRMTNDANCFALSEAVDGAACGYETVFGVILGTGVGGGLVINQQVLPGCNSIAGEWGHNPMPWPQAGEVSGPECYCGLNGCIETYLSGPGLSRTFENICGIKVDAKDIADLPPDISDPVFSLYEHRLARALASVINIFDPDAIVLGGGVSNVERWYETVPTLWEKWVFSDICNTKLLKAQHGDSSGVRGAAWLWPQD